MTSRTTVLCGLLAVCAALAGCSCKEWEDRVLAVDTQVASLQEQVVAREKDIGDLRAAREKLESQVQDLTDERDAFKVRAETVVYQGLGETLTYGVDQYQVPEEQKATLSLVAMSWRQHPDWDLYVEGHTDRQAQDPETQYFIPTAWELAAFRASHAARYLVEREGLPAERVVACSYGNSRPVADNDSEAGRAQNRRVTFFLRAPEAPAAAAAADTAAAPADTTGQ